RQSGSEGGEPQPNAASLPLSERRRLPRGRAFPNQSLPSLAVATIARWWMAIDSVFSSSPLRGYGGYRKT
ncbi:MAG: hypothetical protein ACK5S3_12650, partial [Pirellulaceae bacterium]